MAWVAGSLIDVGGGWGELYPEPGRRRWSYGPSFDAAVASPSGDATALVATVATKGLILDGQGQVVRQINRSFYHADAYRYPAALFTLPDGRTGLAHCPEQYNRLEIEVALTGERLTVSDAREPSDVFHSRLAVSPDGSLLLSAGWLWQPWGSLHVYGLTGALADPTALDGVGDCFNLRGLIQAEVAGACFVNGAIMISTTDAENDPDDEDDLGPNMLTCWSPAQGGFLWKQALDESPGDLVTLAGGGLALNGHPRLYSSATGQMTAEWPDLDLGHSDSAITWADTFRGPGRIAVDPNADRFAYTDGDRVVVIQSEAQ
jgi:hypothetical protein